MRENITKNGFEHLEKFNNPEKPVFKSTDEQINALLEPEIYPEQKEINQRSEFDREISEHSPIPSNHKVKYEATTSNNINENEIENLLKDEGKNSGLKWSEEDEIYNLSIQETYENLSQTEKINPNNIHLSSNDLSLLTIHTVIYEKENGENYMLHWDPGQFNQYGEKEKFEEERGQPNPKKAFKPKSSDSLVYENYETTSLEEGLDRIYDKVMEMSEKLYDQADKMREDIEVSNQEVYETIWKAERWRGMADTVKNFKNNYFNNYNSGEEITV